MSGTSDSVAPRDVEIFGKVYDRRVIDSSLFFQEMMGGAGKLDCVPFDCLNHFNRFMEILSAPEL
jgi:hypothetical protein